MDKKYDKLFHIKTTGIREWPDNIVNYNRCESTPYKSLDILFKRYKLNETHQFIDFGSGRGRVAFYTHNRFKISVIGIEGNIKVYHEALSNLENYKEKTEQINSSIEFKYILAQYYKVQPSDNIFYFFNPFSVEIFQNVIYNILESIEYKKRTVDIILYYPMDDYIDFLETCTPFKLIDEIVVSKDKKDKFLIYGLA